MPNWMQSSFGKVFLINVLQTQRLKSSSFDEYMNIYMLIYEFSTPVETVLNLASFTKI